MTPCSTQVKLRLDSFMYIFYQRVWETINRDPYNSNDFYIGSVLSQLKTGAILQGLISSFNVIQYMLLLILLMFHQLLILLVFHQAWVWRGLNNFFLRASIDRTFSSLFSQKHSPHQLEKSLWWVLSSLNTELLHHRSILTRCPHVVALAPWRWRPRWSTACPGIWQ